MAFNLKKTDSSENNSKSKFNLSKKEVEPIIEGEGSDSGNSKKSTYWIYIVVAAVLVLSFWLYTNYSKKGQDENIKDLTSQTESKSDSPVTTQSEPDSLVDTSNTVTVTNSPITSSPSDQINNQPTQEGEINSEQKIAVNFASGSSDMLEINSNVLEELKSVIKNNPSKKIIVEGYSSSEGSFGFNMQLSKQRANAFGSYLIQNGIPKSNLSIIGRGIENPIADNSTESGRVKNRRVQIRLN